MSLPSKNASIKPGGFLVSCPTNRPRPHNSNPIRNSHQQHVAYRVSDLLDAIKQFRMSMLVLFVESAKRADLMFAYCQFRELKFLPCIVKQYSKLNRELVQCPIDAGLVAVAGFRERGEVSPAVFNAVRDSAKLHAAGFKALQFHGEFNFANDLDFSYFSSQTWRNELEAKALEIVELNKQRTGYPILG